MIWPPLPAIKVVELGVVEVAAIVTFGDALAVIVAVLDTEILSLATMVMVPPEVAAVELGVVVVFVAVLVVVFVAVVVELDDADCEANVRLARLLDAVDAVAAVATLITVVVPV